MLSIIMPVLNNLTYTKSIIQQIDKYTRTKWELIVINDWSIDWTEEYLEMCWLVDQWINFDKSIWVTKAWNAWVMMASYDIICIINNDIDINEWFFDRLVEWLHDVDYIVPRFKTPYSNDIQYFNNFINGFCFMFKKDKWVWPIDESIKIYYNDNWIWLKIKELWYKVKLKHDSIVFHYQSITSKDFNNKDQKAWDDICRENWWDFQPIEIRNDDLQYDLIFNY